MILPKASVEAPGAATGADGAARQLAVNSADRRGRGRREDSSRRRRPVSRRRSCSVTGCRSPTRLGLDAATGRYVDLAEAGTGATAHHLASL